MVVDHGWLETMTKASSNEPLERLLALRKSIDKPASCERLELYHRASKAIRVSSKAGSEAVLSRTGFEEGVAARLRLRGEAAVAFAAASGGGLPSLRWAIDRAVQHGAGRRARQSAWPLRDGQLLDHDTGEELPPARDLIAWLNDSCRRLEERPDCWVEAVTTVESWIADGGGCASRRRTRGWAVARARPRPLILASRRWDELPKSGWADLASDRKHGTVKSAGSRLVLFTAEAAADLVSAIVRGSFVTNERLNAPCGGGWALSDDPTSPQAIFGGSFDDGTFPTRRKSLADGKRVMDLIDGPGHLRRSSFRDPPRPLPSHIVVERQVEASCDGALVVTGLMVHPLSASEWVIEFDGASGADLEGFIRTDPLELMRCCAGACGLPRLSHRGVETPALLFDGLKPQL
jgi:hypothetical protein